jgi:hypothetical protein
MRQSIALRWDKSPVLKAARIHAESLEPGAAAFADVLEELADGHPVGTGRRFPFEAVRVHFVEQPYGRFIGGFSFRIRELSPVHDPSPFAVELLAK